MIVYSIFKYNYNLLLRVIQSFFTLYQNLRGDICFCASLSLLPGYFDEEQNTVYQRSKFSLDDVQHFSKCRYCILMEYI